jgi:chemotaxis protein methyltransferase CheR
MRRAMSALRVADPLTLARAIGTPGEARDTVLAELTIGESYFFREAGQLDVLRDAVIPARLAEGAAPRPLRLWSAGCASGEEPYTLAILLRELGWSHGARILGTDVAAPRLAAARRARYTRWSLRGLSEERTDRWFSPRGGQFQLDPRIRESVEFATLNLVADAYPPQAGTGEQDVILCRNVLIYFEMPTVALVAARLLSALAPDGWLLCGASDPPLNGLVPCEIVMTPGGMAYRRADRLPTAVSAPPVERATEPRRWWAGDIAVAARPPVAAASPLRSAAPTPRPTVAAVAADAAVGQPTADLPPDAVAYAAADYPLAERLGREALGRDPDAATWVRYVRSIANQGRLREADLECTRALDAHRLVAELHYLHATLLAAAGQHAEAARAARRALYLDRSLVMAHLQLGDALARLGDRERARQSFENVVAWLESQPAGAPVAGADGVPAARLRSIAEHRARALAVADA